MYWPFEVMGTEPELSVWDWTLLWLGSALIRIPTGLSRWQNGDCRRLALSRTTWPIFSKISRTVGTEGYGSHIFSTVIVIYFRKYRKTTRITLCPRRHHSGIVFSPLFGKSSDIPFPRNQLVIHFYMGGAAVAFIPLLAQQTTQTMLSETMLQTQYMMEAVA